MGNFKVATDAQAADFPEQVNALLSYCKKNPNSQMYKTASQILQDNIRLYARVQELEAQLTKEKQDEQSGS